MHTLKGNGLIGSILGIIVLLAIQPCFAETETEISYNQTVFGSINKGEKNEFTFDGIKGDVITLHFGRTSGNFSPYLELYDPAGTFIGAALSSSDYPYDGRLDKRLTTTGIFRIVIRDDNNIKEGSYSLTLKKINNPTSAQVINRPPSSKNIRTAQTAINCGEVLTGSISTAGEGDRYTFDAQANDSVTIRATKASSSLYAYLELYAPNGTNLAKAAGKIDKTLPVTGTYTILVRDEFNAYTGDYALTWQRLNNPCALAVNCGQNVNSSIGTSTDTPPWRFYTFDAQANDKVTIRAAKTSGNLYTYLELYAPDGTNLAKARGKIDATLTISGKYTIIVRDEFYNYAGDFCLVLMKINNSCSAGLNSGQLAIGSITTSERFKFYSFSAQANDKVTIRATKASGSLYAYLELYAPDGTNLANGSKKIDKVLPTTGTYVILVRDEYNYYIGDYSLIWQKLNNPNLHTINCGESINGVIGVTVAQPPWMFYSFDAKANDSVTIRAAKTSGNLYTYLELYAPDGNNIANGSGRIDKTLPVTGTYTILVRDQFNAYTGDYALVWQKLNNPCNATPINCGQAISNSISTSGETEFYAFIASANDKVCIPFAEISGNLYLELYSPDGTRLAGIDSGTINTTLSVNGTYTLIVRGYYGADTGDYAITWQILNNPCNATIISYDNPVLGTINNPAQVNAYIFSASLNDNITICSRVDSTTLGSLGTYLELCDTSGNLLENSYDSLKHTFASGGTFYLFVRDSYRDGTGTYKMYLARGDVFCPTIDLVSPVVSLRQPRGGEVVEGGSIYAISWASSDNVGITAQEIRLSTDSGLTYPTVIVSNLPASAQSYNWQVPDNLSATKGRIKIAAVDANNNSGEDESSADFIIAKTTLPAEAKDTDYEYDTLSRLTHVSYASGIEDIYTYDALGNRLTLNISGQSQEWELILSVPSYQEEKDYYSAAASCKMALDYIRQDTSLTQDEIYNYAATGSGNRELNPGDVERILNHFKPAPYNFGIIAKLNINEAMRDIVHWLDYEVPAASVPHSPVLIPTFGRYDNWMVVRGAAASEDPNANQNLWQTGSFTVYGFWLSDPAVRGIGDNSYKTAAELESNYYLALSEGDSWQGKFVAVAEPPKRLSQAQVKIAQPFVSKSTSQLEPLFKANDQIAMSQEGKGDNFILGIKSYILSIAAKKNIERRLQQFNWKDIIDPFLLKDVDFRAALKDTITRPPIKVRRLDLEDNYYYLIPFEKFINGRYLASVILIVDSSNYSFKEASWVKSPIRYPLVTREEALALAQREASHYQINKEVLNSITAELVWEPGEISTSPYKPFWRVTIGDRAWFVTEDGKIEEIR